MRVADLPNCWDSPATSTARGQTTVRYRATFSSARVLDPSERFAGVQRPGLFLDYTYLRHRWPHNTQPEEAALDLPSALRDGPFRGRLRPCREGEAGTQGGTLPWPQVFLELRSYGWAIVWKRTAAAQRFASRPYSSEHSLSFSEQELCLCPSVGDAFHESARHCRHSSS